MRLKDIFTLRISILLIMVIFSLMAINPHPYAEGVQIKSIETGSAAANSGLKEGTLIEEINQQEVKTIEDFNKIKLESELEPYPVTVETDKGIFTYNITNNFGFSTDNNLTIIYSDVEVPINSKLMKINNLEMNSTGDLDNAILKIIKRNKFTIKTNKGEFSFLSNSLGVKATPASSTNLKKGLDLQGGTRVLIQPTEEVSDKQVQDIIAVLNNRLNVYGLSDLKIRQAKGEGDTKYILIELAGATREEVKELIGKQGKFEAKINNQTVFSGGKEDIPFVCRGDGSCSGIRPPCSQTGESSWYCKFEFSIHLSPEAAKRHAEVTKDLQIVKSQSGSEVLESTIDFYLDGKLVDSLQIGADLKGREATAIAISGPGTGATKSEAGENALKNMNKLQTILITGSLPTDIEIVKLDTISPMLGSSFIKNSIMVGLLAILTVAIVIFIRYKTWKIVIPIVITSLSEVTIILGFAALTGWNLDLASIAGIIAAVGTGVDDQIVITDEILKSSGRIYNWKEKIKRAFFIIFTAYATTLAAMFPLWNAGAGLIRGFAVTTIVGVTIGVLITRPAFANIAEKLLKE